MNKSRTNTTSTNNTINQNQLVIGYLRRSRRRLTSEEICEAINSDLKTKKVKSRLTIQQVSKCLNRFTEKNMVQKVDSNGTFSSGRKAARWTYVSRKA